MLVDDGCSPMTLVQNKFANNNIHKRGREGQGSHVENFHKLWLWNTVVKCESLQIHSGQVDEVRHINELDI